MEGSLLESEFLPFDSRRCTNRSNKGIYRKSGGKEEMNKAFRFRIYPNKKQEELLQKTFGCARFIYNKMLGEKIAYYELTGETLKTTPAKYKEEYPFLKEVDSLALANAQLHLETAYKNFYQNPKIGFPKFKSKHKSAKAYTTNVVNGNIELIDGKLKLPKIENVRIKQHRPIPEGYKLKAVTISQEPSGKYYASLLYYYEGNENQVMISSDSKILGIDYAMHGMAVFSDELEASNPGYMKMSIEKLAKEQRRLSRCQKGSKNYEKQKRKVALCHEKVKNQRKDYIHKLSRKICEEYMAVGVEDIDMKAMSQCLNFGKSVMDNSYGMFRDVLKYKLEEQGKKLVKVDRFYPSSKTCSSCGRVKESLELSERIYRCECGLVMDRDKNAAINIREEARRMLIA